MSGAMVVRCLRAAGAAIGIAVVVLVAVPAQAMKIEEITSPGGIHAWLVRGAAVPLVAINFAFTGGTSQDPPDRPGVANMVSDLLDEGAGKYDSRAFHQRLDDLAVEFRFSAGRDEFRGSLRVLKENTAPAFQLLRLMLTEPHFDPAAVERIRTQIRAGLLREAVNPGHVAQRAWWSTAFPNHPYGRPLQGTPESLQRITVDDLKAYRNHVFARDRLKVALVGDVTPEEAGKLLDVAFGGLAAKAELAPVPEAMPQGLGKRIVRQVDVPQTSVIFGGAGVPRHDPQFIAAYIDNHILGGGTFSSWLYQEVREKRGLAYSIDESLVWLKDTALVLGGTAARSDRTADALAIINRQIERMRAQGPTASELAKAKSYLKGSYALSLDTSSKIAAQLVQIQIDHLGIDYIDRRRAMIDAVTLDDAKRAAKRLFQGGVLVTVAGRTDSLVSKTKAP